MLWFRVPEKVYIKKGCLTVALDELGTVMNKKRAFVVTDTFLFEHGYTKPITDKLNAMGIQYATFSNVEPDPTLACAKAGAEQMRNYYNCTGEIEVVKRDENGNLMFTEEKLFKGNGEADDGISYVKKPVTEVITMSTLQKWRSKLLDLWPSKKRLKTQTQLSLNLS